MGNPDKNDNGADDGEAATVSVCDAASSHQKSADNKRSNKKSIDAWDAARLKGWRGTAWEDRIGEPPPPRREPWYLWVAIGVMTISILLPLLIELWGFLMAP